MDGRLVEVRRAITQQANSFSNKERELLNRLECSSTGGSIRCRARHEWVRNKEKISNGQYQKYFDRFYPDLYNPEEWAGMAKNAGMKYFVITVKHHEGFCLWDSKHTKYKATETPWKKDILKPMVNAFRKAGLKVGLYYSLIDWHHPHFTVDGIHLMRDCEEERKKNKDRDIRKYTEYMHNQVKEILTGFGKIDILWFDFSYPGKDGKGRDDWQSEKLLKMIRKLQPGIMIGEAFRKNVEYAQFLHDGSEVLLQGLESWQAGHWSLGGKDAWNWNGNKKRHFENYECIIFCIFS